MKFMNSLLEMGRKVNGKNFIKKHKVRTFLLHVCEALIMLLMY